jgi:hypothetical protein
MTALNITDTATVQKAEAIAKMRGIPAEQALKDMVSAAYEAQTYFAERARRGNPAEALAILARLGVGNEPDEGDELPPANAKDAPK